MPAEDAAECLAIVENAPVQGPGRNQTGRDGSKRPSSSPHAQTASPPSTSANGNVQPRFRVLRFWAWEILSLASAVIVFALMFTLMLVVQDLPVPSWRYGISPNSIVAILSTILRASLFIVVAEVLGQTRWFWFDEQRRLDDLQDFDRASRGITGSLSLLWKLLFRGVKGGDLDRGDGSPARTLAALCCLLVALSPAVGAFSQQAITTGPCTGPVWAGSASVPIAQYVPGLSGSTGIGSDLDLDTDMKAAMIKSLSDPESINRVAAVCPTGNCTFSANAGPEYASIGLCNRCVDASEFAVVEGLPKWGNYSVRLPEGAGQLNLSGGSSDNWMTVVEGAKNSYVADKLGDVAAESLINVTVLALTQAPCRNGEMGPGQPGCNFTMINYPRPGNITQTGLVAASCSFYPCLKTYKGEARSGVLNETILSTRPARRPNPDNGGDYMALLDPCRSLRGMEIFTSNNISNAGTMPGEQAYNVSLPANKAVRVVEAPSHCVYRFGRLYSMAMGGFMNKTLFPSKGSLGVICRSTMPTVNKGGFGIVALCGEQWWLNPLWEDARATFASISAAMDGLSTATTNRLRATGEGWNASRISDPAAVSVRGNAWESQLCTHINWLWLLLPGGLVAATTAILSCAVAGGHADRSRPVWKGSVLPLVMYGRVPAEEELMTTGRDVAEDQNAGSGRGEVTQQGTSRELMDLKALEAEAKETKMTFRGTLGPGFVVTAAAPGSHVLADQMRGGDVEMSSLLPKADAANRRGWKRR